MAREFIVKGEISRLILAVRVDAYVKRVCQDCMFAMRVVTTVQGASCIASCVNQYEGLLGLCLFSGSFNGIPRYMEIWSVGVCVCVCK